MAPSLGSLNIARLPSVLDPIVMECSEFRAFFWASSQSPTIPPTEDRGLWLRDCVAIYLNFLHTNRAVARRGIGGAPPNFYKIAQFGNFFNPIRKVWRQAYLKKIIHLCPYNLIKFKEILQSCSK